MNQFRNVQQLGQKLGESDYEQIRDQNDGIKI